MDKIKILPEGHRRYGVLAPNKYAFFIEEIQVKCPVCGRKFGAASPILSKLSQKEYKVAFDQRITYENFDELWYSIWVCNTCNYADYASTFGQIDQISRVALIDSGYEHLVEKFKGFSKPLSVDSVIESYYLALLCNKMGKKNTAAEAKTWMRLYWLYGDRNDMANKRNAAQNALAKYENISLYADGAERLFMFVIMAELAISLGEYERAAAYYEMAAANSKKSNPAINAQAQSRLAEIKLKQR